MVETCVKFLVDKTWISRGRDVDHFSRGRTWTRRGFHVDETWITFRVDERGRDVDRIFLVDETWIAFLRGRTWTNVDELSVVNRAFSTWMNVDGAYFHNVDERGWEKLVAGLTWI